MEGIKKELANLKENSAQLKARWQAEKDKIKEIRSTKEQIEQVRIDTEKAERQGDLNRAAELKYGRMNELNQRLEDLNKEFVKACEDAAKSAVLHERKQIRTIELKKALVQRRRPKKN